VGNLIQRADGGRQHPQACCLSQQIQSTPTARAIYARPNFARFYLERASFYVQIGNIQQEIAIHPDDRLFQHWRNQLIDALD
jgi:hypothetical protein